MIMSLITANTAGSTKRSTVNAAFFVSYCVGNIIGPFAFKTTEAPAYTSGIIAVLVAFVVEIAALSLFALYMAGLNKRKEKKQMEAVGRAGADEDQSSFEDLTDFQNPSFRYTY